MAYAEQLKVDIHPLFPEKIKCVLEVGAFMPEKSHEDDAGFDIRAMERGYVPAHGQLTVRTGVHVAIPKGFAGELISKSGLNSKSGITTTGLIDSGYTGEIKVVMRNTSKVDYRVEVGDKISQLVIYPIWTGVIERVESLEETERGSNGFGSTGIQ